MLCRFLLLTHFSPHPHVAMATFGISGDLLKPAPPPQIHSPGVPLHPGKMLPSDLDSSLANLVGSECSASPPVFVPFFPSLTADAPSLSCSFQTCSLGGRQPRSEFLFPPADLRDGHQGAPQPSGPVRGRLISLLFAARPELQWSQLVEKKPTGGGGWQSKTMCTSTNWTHATHPMAPAPMPVPQMVTVPRVLHSVLRFRSS